MRPAALSRRPAGIADAAGAMYAAGVAGRSGGGASWDGSPSLAGRRAMYAAGGAHLAGRRLVAVTSRRGGPVCGRAK
jgi:hypothetical protein